MTGDLDRIHINPYVRSARMWHDFRICPNDEKTDPSDGCQICEVLQQVRRRTEVTTAMEAAKWVLSELDSRGLREFAEWCERAAQEIEDEAAKALASISEWQRDSEEREAYWERVRSGIKTGPES